MKRWTGDANCYDADIIQICQQVILEGFVQFTKFVANRMPQDVEFPDKGGVCLCS